MYVSMYYYHASVKLHCNERFRKHFNSFRSTIKHHHRKQIPKNFPLQQNDVWSWAFTTVFVDTRLSKTKHPRKRFQNFRQSCMLSTDRIEIHQSQPANMTWRRSEGHTSGCDWWILIRSVDNTHDWRKFWKRFRGCFLFESRVSTKTVVKMANAPKWTSIDPLHRHWKKTLWPTMN